MAKANNKRIEESATTALKATLLCCPFLDSYIDSNDKTPSWDGTIFVYRDEKQTKDTLMGRVPIQVKGTEKRIASDTTSYSCSVSDIRNYYNDGGCVFFLVSVTPDVGEYIIFYASLLVYDLKQILDNAGKQKSSSIKLKRFPSGNVNEIASIFMSFVENSRKQISFIGKDIYTFDQLKSNGVSIEKITFNTSGIGLNMYNIGDFITTHDIYLYAKPKGIDIEIPVDKVSHAIVSRPVAGNVMVKDKEYYPTYNILYKEGKKIIEIGKSICFSIDQTFQKFTFNFKPSGTLDDFIKDATFFIDFIETRELTLNGIRLPFHGNMSMDDLDEYKRSLRYYQDAKRMLNILGVVEDLECDQLTKTDEKNIRNFVNALLYNKKLTFHGASNSTIYGAFSIANLSIWIWADRKSDGYYQLGSFFSTHKIAAFREDDDAQAAPVPASHYLLLNKNAFVHASNMDYEAVTKDICSMERHPLLIDDVTFLLLNALRGYDEQSQKDVRTLNLADAICDWLAGFDDKIDLQILALNRLQIIRRRRKFTITETLELAKLADVSCKDNIRCGAYVLLGDCGMAQACFDRMPASVQAEFITFPICHFGNLKMNGGTN